MMSFPTVTPHSTCPAPHLTVDADPSTCVDAADVQARLLPLHVRVVEAVGGVAMAVAGCNGHPR